MPGATGFFDTNYEAKGKYAIETLKEVDVLFIHVEAPDEAGHAQLIDEKIKAIERIDEFNHHPDNYYKNYPTFFIHSSSKLL